MAASAALTGHRHAAVSTASTVGDILKQSYRRPQARLAASPTGRLATVGKSGAESPIGVYYAEARDLVCLGSARHALSIIAKGCSGGSTSQPTAGRPLSRNAWRRKKAASPLTSVAADPAVLEQVRHEGRKWRLNFWPQWQGTRATADAWRKIALCSAGTRQRCS